VEFIIEIEDDKYEQIKEAILQVHPNEQTELIDNPYFISKEETPNEPEKISIKKYTDDGWIEHLAEAHLLSIANTGAKRKRQLEIEQTAESFAGKIKIKNPKPKPKPKPNKEK